MSRSSGIQIEQWCDTMRLYGCIRLCSFLIQLIQRYTQKLTSFPPPCTFCCLFNCSVRRGRVFGIWLLVFVVFVSGAPDRAAAGGPFLIPTVVVQGRPPDADSDACANATLWRGFPMDVELGPAEIIRGMVNFGDVSLFATAHEKLKQGATYSPMRLQRGRQGPGRAPRAGRACVSHF